jgi:hypothetical protein
MGNVSNNNQPASIWFAVDEDGSEWVYTHKPKRIGSRWSILFGEGYPINNPIFPVIQAITGKTLTWQDEPIEWKPPKPTQNYYDSSMDDLLINQQA